MSYFSYVYRYFCVHFFVLVSLSASGQRTVGVILHNQGSIDSGYVLFAPINYSETYLIDKCGHEINSWSSTYPPGQSVYLLEDGTLLRTGNVNNPAFNSGGRGGVLEKIDWQGNILWTYFVSNQNICQHHDVCPLPNGNILAIVLGKKRTQKPF